MKNILAILFVCISFVLSAQQEKIKIDPNQSKNQQHIGISSNGKQILGKRNRPYGTYETKGSFKSVLLTDFANALANYIDSLGLISGGGGSDSANIFNEPVTKDRELDANGFDFGIDEIRTFEFNRSNGSNKRLEFDFNYDGAVRIEAGGDVGFQIEQIGDGRFDLRSNAVMELYSGTGIHLYGEISADQLGIGSNTSGNRLVTWDLDNTLDYITPVTLPTEPIVFDIGMNTDGELVQEEVTPVELPYYELVAKLSTDGTTAINYNEVSNTFPQSWGVNSAGGGAFTLIYDDAGLDLYTIVDDIITTTTSSWNIVESAVVSVTGGYVFDVHEIDFFLLKNNAAGTAADFEEAFLTAPIQITIRWYHP